MSPVKRGTPTGPILASLALVAVVGMLYGNATRLWWTLDDFYCIRFLHEHAPLSYLFSPDLWRQHRMFTPLLLLSYQADALAFGFRPQPFYVHQLAALAATAAALFCVLRLWLVPRVAFAAALLFLLGAPVVAWVPELLVRHYVEGLLCALLSVACFIACVRGKRPGLSLLSAALYFAAMLAKEVYVPLVALLLLLPEGDLRLRVRRARPHFVSLVVYLVWRYAMLGTFAGGYGWTVRPEELPGLGFALPGKIGASFLSGSRVWSGILVASLAAGLCAALYRSRRATWLHRQRKPRSPGWRGCSLGNQHSTDPGPIRAVSVDELDLGSFGEPASPHCRNPHSFGLSDSDQPLHQPAPNLVSLAGRGIALRGHHADRAAAQASVEQI